MLSMKRAVKPKFPDKQVLKTCLDSKEAIHLILPGLRRRLRWFDSQLSIEAYTNALWLWAEELGPEKVAEGIRPHLLRLEAILEAHAAGEQGTYSSSEPAPPKTHRKKA